MPPTFRDRFNYLFLFSFDLVFFIAAHRYLFTLLFVVSFLSIF